MRSEQYFLPLNLDDIEKEDDTVLNEDEDHASDTYSGAKSRLDYSNLIFSSQYVPCLLVNSYKKGKLIGIFLFVLFLSITTCNWIYSSNEDLSVNLTVMSFNTWGSGANENKTAEDTISVLKAINPDVICLLEVRAESVPCTSICPPSGESRAPEIARALGYFLHEQQGKNDLLWANAILSRYPILYNTAHDAGVVLDVLGAHVALFSIHLTDFPYQPYQLLDIPCDGAPSLETAQDAIEAADNARGPGVNLLLEEIHTISDDVSTVIVAGDFNEPSHLDWTERAVAIGRHPLAVEFPTSMKLEAHGFIDSYRSIYPDEIEKPGFTWTPKTTDDDKQDHHDRIDYILVRNATVISASIIGENPFVADIVINTPWPSDHRAIVATVSIPF